MIKAVIEVAIQERTPKINCKIAFHLIKIDLPILSEYDWIYDPILTPKYTTVINNDFWNVVMSHYLYNSGNKRPIATD